MNACIHFHYLIGFQGGGGSPSSPDSSSSSSDDESSSSDEEDCDEHDHPIDDYSDDLPLTSDSDGENEDHDDPAESPR